MPTRAPTWRHSPWSRTSYPNRRSLLASMHHILELVAGQPTQRTRRSGRSDIISNRSQASGPVRIWGVSNPRRREHNAVFTQMPCLRLNISMSRVRPSSYSACTRYPYGNHARVSRGTITPTNLLTSRPLLHDPSQEALQIGFECLPRISLSSGGYENDSGRTCDQRKIF